MRGRHKELQTCPGARAGPVPVRVLLRTEPERRAEEPQAHRDRRQQTVLPLPVLPVPAHRGRLVQACVTLCFPVVAYPDMCEAAEGPLCRSPGSSPPAAALRPQGGRQTPTQTACCHVAPALSRRFLTKKKITVYIQSDLKLRRLSCKSHFGSRKENNRIPETPTKTTTVAVAGNSICFSSSTLFFLSI